MEFQNEPFQALKGRVDELEGTVEYLRDMVEALAAALEKRPYGYVQVGASEPEKVRKEQDDA